MPGTLTALDIRDDHITRILERLNETAAPPVFSPAALTGATHNWDIGATTGVVRASSTGSVTITGIAGGTSSRRVTIINVGNQDLVFDHLNASSAEANRLSMPNNVAFTLQGWASGGGTSSGTFEYDATTAVWRLVAAASLLLPRLFVTGATTLAGDVGFCGAAATSRQTVTGSRGGNAALASLLTALATLGLITDNSSA